MSARTRPHTNPAAANARVIKVISMVGKVISGWLFTVYRWIVPEAKIVKSKDFSNIFLRTALRTAVLLGSREREEYSNVTLEYHPPPDGTISLSRLTSRQ